MKIKEVYTEWKQKAKKGFLPFLAFIAFFALTYLYPELLAKVLFGITLLIGLVGFPYVFGRIVSDYKEKQDES